LSRVNAAQHQRETFDFLERVGCVASKFERFHKLNTSIQDYRFENNDTRGYEMSEKQNQIKLAKSNVIIAAPNDNT
jgi:hypothetical protein